MLFSALRTSPHTGRQHSPLLTLDGSAVGAMNSGAILFFPFFWWIGIDGDISDISCLGAWGRCLARRWSGQSSKNTERPNTTSTHLSSKSTEMNHPTVAALESGVYLSIPFCVRFCQALPHHPSLTGAQAVKARSAGQVRSRFPPQADLHDIA